ncbi:MAG: hypothetical protein DRH37_05595 [Deltaproteobacteria bacterium]|nr:MAG: hypothetical protein DRH37_05595 [Deltaproteobacteria bacterium]
MSSVRKGVAGTTRFHNFPTYPYHKGTRLCQKKCCFLKGRLSFFRFCFLLAFFQENIYKNSVLSRLGDL